MKITVMHCILLVSLGTKKKVKGRWERHCGWMGHDLCCEGEEGSEEMPGMLSFLLAQCLRSRCSASPSVSARGG